METGTKLKGTLHYKITRELLEQNKAVTFAPIQKCSHCGNEITASEFDKAVKEELILFRTVNIENDPVLHSCGVYFCPSCLKEARCDYVVVHDESCERFPVLKETMRQAILMLEANEITGQEIPESGVLIKWNGEVVSGSDIPPDSLPKNKLPRC